MREVMSELPSPPKTFTLSQGNKINLYNRQPNPMEVVIEGADGLKVRFNLLVGHGTKITVGTVDLNISLNESDADLIGVPTPD
jgi:hypothetical protein